MNYIKYPLLIFIILLSNNYVYSQFNDFDSVCCYLHDEFSSIGSQEVQGMIHRECRNQGGITLGLQDPQNSPEIDRTIVANRIFGSCTGYIVDNGVECKLPSGSLSQQTFFFNWEGINYPLGNSCQSFEQCPDNGCSWQFSEVIPGEETPPEVDDDLPPLPPILPPIIDDDEDIIELEDSDLGLRPFPIADRSLCEIPRGPFRGALTSRQYCESISNDCVYDPLRAGIITQRVGDSLPDNRLFSVFESDIKCVSKSNSIRTCEDINSRSVCDNFMNLNPNESSLMYQYGCEWREFNDFVGTCVTKDLYFETSQDEISKSINIQNAILRSNFIKNPTFELHTNENLKYWDGQYGLVTDNVYNGLLGSNVVRIQSSNDYIEQQISGIPINSDLEVVVVVSPYQSFVGIDSFIDDSKLMVREGYPKPLFLTSDSRSNILVYSYEFENSLELSTRNFKVQGLGDVDILGVSINLISGDQSSTLQNNIYRVSSISQFPENSFNCGICSMGLFPGLCSEDSLSAFGNCELLSTGISQPYKWGNPRVTPEHLEINPYESLTGIENIFIEEDMAFCGLYTTQKTCENPNNKLNSQIKNYHSTQHTTLCKWASRSDIPGEGFCYKDSVGNNLPDTIQDGNRPYVQGSSFDISQANYYQINSNGLNDFQLSCDSIPPSLFVEMFKTYIDQQGNIRNGSTLHIDSNSSGVIRRVHVRIDNQISQACSVFEDFTPRLHVMLFDEDDSMVSPAAISASSLFSGFTGQEVFQSTYSFSEFRRKLIEVSALNSSNVDNFLRNGSMRLIDASGNVQKNLVNLNAGAGVGEFNFQLEFMPLINNSPLENLYSFSYLRIGEVTTPIADSSLEETCEVEIYDLTNSQMIHQVNQSFLNFRVDIGQIARGYVNQEEIDGDINVTTSVTCSNYFGNSVSRSRTMIFSNKEQIIFTIHDSDVRRNNDDILYLNTQSYVLPLTLTALNGVSCPQTLLIPIDVQGSQNILELGKTQFSQIQGNQIGDYTLQNNTGIDIRTRAGLSSSELISDGLYDITFECNVFGEEEFTKLYRFEVNTDQVDLSELNLIHKYNTEWKLFNDLVYVNALGESLVASGQPIKDNINQYIQENLILNIEDSIRDEILSLNICGVNVILDDSLLITQPLFTATGQSDCSVEYNEEFSYIELHTLVQVESLWGADSEVMVITIIEMHSPQIKVSTSSGGQLIDGILYHNDENNNPTINVTMNLQPQRGFTCEIQPIVNGDSSAYNPTSFNSDSSDALDFRISNLNGIGSDILQTLDLIKFELEINCQEDLFEKTSNKTIELVKNTQAPIIESIRFLNSQGNDMGYTWSFPTTGGSSDNPESQLRGNIEVSFSNVNPYVSCELKAVVEEGSNKFIVNTIANPPLSQSSSDTNRLVFEDILLLARQGVSSTPLVLVDSSGSSRDTSNFSISLRCQGGGGEVDVNNDVEIQIQLFDFASAGVRGETNRNKRLNLEIDSVVSLKDFTITIRDGRDSDNQLYSGPISSTNHNEINLGGIRRLNIVGIDINIDELEEDNKYPLYVNLSSGGSFSTEEVIEILVDNTNPSVEIVLPVNEEGIIHQSQLSGNILFSDLPLFSNGVQTFSAQLNGGSYSDSIEYDINQNRDEIISGSVALRQFDGFEDLEVGHYELSVEVVDFYGNTNTTTLNFFVSDEAEITLLASNNVGIFELDRNVWYTNNLKPHLNFTSTSEFDSCRLRPGPSGGYDGSSIQFEKRGEFFELNTNNLEGSSSFTILEGKRQVQIVCNELDETQHIFAVYLYKLDSFHDYILSIDWGNHQIVPPYADSKVVNFSIMQRSLFTDVTCKLNIEGIDSDDIVLNPSSSNGNYRGSVELNPRSEPYIFELKCTNPLNVTGPVKQYSVVVQNRNLDDNQILSVSNDALGFNYEVDQRTIILPRQITTQSDNRLKVMFTNEYQGELNCQIDTTKSGIVNFITSLFRNTRVDASPVTQGLYQGIVEIDSATTQIIIRCLHDEFRISGDPYQVNFFDIQSSAIGNLIIEEER